MRGPCPRPSCIITKDKIGSIPYVRSMSMSVSATDLSGSDFCAHGQIADTIYKENKLKQRQQNDIFEIDRNKDLTKIAENIDFFLARFHKHVH